MAFVSRLEKFLVEANILFDDGEAEDLNQSIMSINVKDDFLNNAFPLFVIKLRVPEALLNKIRDRQSDINLRVFQYLYDETNDELDADTSDISAENLVFNTNLKVMLKPYITTSTVADSESTVTTEESEDNQTTIPMFNLELTGIPTEPLEMNQKVVNEVFQSVVPADAVVNLISTYGNQQAVYMELPDNKVSEDFILVPPMNLIPALRFIQDIYGVYSTGLNAYFGIDGNYVFSTLKSKESPTNVLNLKVISSSEVGESSNYKTIQMDEDSNFELVLQTAPSFQSMKHVANDTLGETAIFNSYDYNYNLVTRDKSNIDAGNGKVRYFWNSNDNIFFEDSAIAQAKALQESTSVALTNINPLYFGISTKVVIQSNHDYLNGEYAIINRSYSISSNNFKEYSAQTVLTLTKIA